MTRRELRDLKASATALLISGVLNLAFATLMILGGIGRLLLRFGELPADQAQKAGFVAATVLGYGMALITLAASPLIIYGAAQMMKASSYRTVVAAAVLSVIPFTSCCFVLGLPTGIWALAVLYRAGTREIFKGTANGH